MKTAVNRQNDKEAITLLRASLRCSRNERAIKYLMIFLSFGICLIAIFNRYLTNMFSGVENISSIRDDAARYITLISGAILVMGIPLNFLSSRMHTESTVLKDRYEAYVFNNAANNSILRPVSQSNIELYAQKIHGRNTKFRNQIYPAGTEVDETTAQFEYIRNKVNDDYNLYLYVQPFFLTLWIGFCILIVIMAIGFGFEENFVATIINVFVPSLSAVTMITTSWYNYRLQMRQLANLINIIDSILAKPEIERRHYIADKTKMRLLADGLFNYCASAFVIPDFLIRAHKRSILRNEKKQAAAIAEEEEYIERTSSKKSSASTTKTTAAKTTTSKTTSASAGKGTSPKTGASAEKPRYELVRSPYKRKRTKK